MCYNVLVNKKYTRRKSQYVRLLLMGKINICIDCDTAINLKQKILSEARSRTGIDNYFNTSRYIKSKEVKKSLTQKTIYDYISATDFWKNVNFDKNFMVFYNKHKDNFDWCFTANGAEFDLGQRRRILEKEIKSFEFLANYVNGESDYELSSEAIIYEPKDIYISDNEENIFNSKSKINILVDSGKDKYSLSLAAAGLECYVCNTWEEISDIVKWFFENRTAIEL